MALAQLVDVGKRYTKHDDVPTLLAGARHMLRRSKRSELWAVRHVDLTVERGEAIGVIGRNGSGKSTTLGMLAGVTAPTEGIVRVSGRLAPLLRLGVGFEQELTGRENVFINGMILGLTTKEIESRFDSIVAFAELEQFIDTPVKFYSSGMLVRLGFASAVAADPDLLIVDEVLAVGDISFQLRSFDRMMEMRANGATLVVVSHNISAIRRLAERVMVLHHGEVRFIGPTNEAVSMYHDLLREPVGGTEDQAGSLPAADILSFEMLDESGLPTSNVRSGESVSFHMQVRFEETLDDALFGLNIASESGQLVYEESSVDKVRRTYRAGEVYAFRITASLGLTSGSYTAIGGIRWGSVVAQQVTSTAKVFYVSGRPLIRGVVDLDATFEVEASALGDVAALGTEPEDYR